jgi:hypothetical protein
MLSNNKILTVSYGTFSCTLEGFDDSFHTMKAIAEYFRDLASDDRYFGAEPPQPDAEMLARIAEREIARRVEARTNDGRIFLSATAPQTAPAPMAPQQQAPAAESAAAEPAAQPAPAETAKAEEAAKHITPEMIPETDAVQLQDVAGDADDQDAIDSAFDRANASDMLAPPAIAAVKDAKTEAEAFFADTKTDIVAGEPEDQQAETAEAEDVVAPVRDRVVPHADSIAAKLERIRAVVSQADDDDKDDDYSEDEHAENFVPGTAYADDDYEDESEDMQAQDDALMNALMNEDDEAAEEAAQDVVAEAAADVTAALDTDDSMTMSQEDDNEDVAAILARFDDSMSDNKAEAPEVAADDSDDMNLFGDDDDNYMDEDDDEEIMIVDEDDDIDNSAASSAPRIARIVKVKRADLEAAIAQGNLEEMSDEDDEDEEDRSAIGSSLSDEDEHALMRELADVEGSMSDVEKDENNAAQAVSKLNAAGEGDMDRLMAKADAQMGEPESARNRDAFAHLRAAVAAKNSDEGIVGAKIAEDALEVRAYQTDLADVVKPRRPEARGTGSSRPAPLKLVAEQRVDSVVAASDGPVRPRRVSAAPAVVEVDSGHSFAEFAEDMGAHNLPDLLEAAAAYLVFVEEREQFSRPQVMTKVRQVIGADFSREDGLRSFGQLLRAGKIEKIKGGRFAVSGDIGFRPDQRAAG